MRMLRILMACVLAFALAGCMWDDAEKSISVAAENASDGAGYSPLPAGLQLPPGYHLREDRFYVTKKKGHLRRAVTLEVLDREQGRAVEDIEGLMHRGGYRTSGDPIGGRRGAKLKFKKKKNPTITVEFLDDVGKKPANPRARHLVVFRWKVANTLEEWLAKDGGQVP